MEIRDVRSSSFFLSFFLSSSSPAGRGKKDGDREHPDDFHKKNLL